MKPGKFGGLTDWPYWVLAVSPPRAYRFQNPFASIGLPIRVLRDSQYG